MSLLSTFRPAHVSMFPFSVSAWFVHPCPAQIVCGRGERLDAKCLMRFDGVFAVIEPGGSLKLPSAFGLHDGWRYEAEKSGCTKINLLAAYVARLRLLP